MTKTEQKVFDYAQSVEWDYMKVCYYISAMTLEEWHELNGADSFFKTKYFIENHKPKQPELITLPIDDYNRLRKLDDVKIIWYNPEREKPLCYKSGNWDGKRSEQVLVELKDGNYIVATCYEGFMDNSHFFDWYHGVDEWELKEEEVRRWMKIPD